MKPILLAGEISRSADAGRGAYNGAARFVELLAAEGVEVRQLGAADCEAEFPRAPKDFDAYAAVVLSDVGALPLLLTPAAKAGLPDVNRLDSLRRWVEGGGGLMMAGGYMSFQGADGLARFHGTPVEDCLPVECRPHADGLEIPEGQAPTVCEPGHPALADVPQPWPVVLGLNLVSLRPGSRLLARCDYRGASYPLLAVRDYGKGRTLAWTTDIGPHWLSRPFLDWPGYRPLAANLIRWIAGEI